MGNAEVREVWQSYWARNRDKELSLDEMSKTILAELLENSGGVAGKKILEAGCGRGVISAATAELGAEVTLLDISPEALGIAQGHFSSENLQAAFVQGDILLMPFGRPIFDIVWNAGVMEHFEGDLQSAAVRHIVEIIKPGGLFITFNPSAKAFFYLAGKRAAERRGTWPYGPEFPVESLKGICEEAGLTVLREYHICFKENLSYLSYVSKHLRSVVKMLLRPFSQEFLIKTFGGYLIVTVARKERR